MAGNDERAGRSGARLARLEALLDRQIAHLEAAPPDAPDPDRVAKTVRALALAERALADARWSAARLRAAEAAAADGGGAGDEEEDDDDAFDPADGRPDDRPRLDPQALDALRDEVERRFARFDTEPVGALAPDPRPVRGGPPGVPGVLADAGARPAGAAEG